ncbi:MAG TPA: aldo/keto reductase [Roseiarcus sp.]
MSESVLVEIAAKHKKTPAQVVIRWRLDSGLIVIPKTVRLERLKENVGVFDFRLDGDDMKRIETLDSVGGPMGPDPATAAF